MKVLYWVAWVLSVVGALNWGLVGAFGYNLVASLSMGSTGFENTVYVVVGLSAIVLIIAAIRMPKTVA